MKTKRHVAGVTLAAAAAVAAVAAARVKAQDVPELVATGQFGLMGAARGEVVRLSVSNVNLVPPDPCRASLSFVDGRGDVLHRTDGTPIRKDVVLGAGQSASLQFHAGALLGGDETRLNFRPVLMVPRPDPNVPPDPCVPSLELVDNATGQTRLLSPGATRTYSFNHNETLVEDR